MVAIVLAPSPDAAIASPRPALIARRVPAAVLLGIVVGWLALDLLMLCRFVGLAQPLVYAGWAMLSAGLFWLLTLPRRRDLHAGPTVGTLLACVGVAVALLLLGGEGRFFYANVDWQVRDAVLRDMTVNPWPFAYASGDLLRAPIGMYLVPALAGKLWGQAGADLVLLGQNGLLLGLLFAIGATLFADRRKRLIALAVFLAFSGLDILGQVKVGHAALLVPTAHLEGWGPTQFSSTITLAFWVPQHAIAGWIGALGFLLWRVDRLGLGSLLMLPPMTALWSPLAAIGAMPFILHAVWTELRRRRITLADIALPACATAIALPALAYLAAAGEAVGARFFPIRPDVYLVFLTIELFPWLLIAFAGRRARFGGPVLAIATGSLLAMPLIQVGWWIDFAMRASIPALSILALHLADGLGGTWALSARRRAALVLLLALGSVTGLTEIARALTFPVSPPPRCGFSRAWDESFSAFPKGSYLAPLAGVPTVIRPVAPARARPDATADCFPTGWPKPPLF
ncbi:MULTISPECIES: hypothetical protein [unclassified Sphingomonas]|uniref:hypothetical protein n=1 Tax=unclassified Sphingomonas TaxID=196159 RepID=UPI0006F7C2C8|nr:MULTISPECIES: hypothetical protein [unclassified Sphingomonas]KQX17918.1 hypothetical protein ASD17_19665 [Sphingomonas sp. Root1294]KQY70843.1 hypothetical protein ASD39_23565 [Sphingomonas sp. Root50]KRB91662.1 hypothetical protein ASE22_06745 [Sphingomonas sp. Root720]